MSHIQKWIVCVICEPVKFPKERMGAGGETEWEKKGMVSIPLFSSAGWGVRAGSQISSIIYPKKKFLFLAALPRVSAEWIKKNDLTGIPIQIRLQTWLFKRA